MCSVSVLFCIVVLTLLAAGDVSCVVDYCETHQYNSSTPWLQFTKEVSNKEYAIASTFKSLHCCAKGYRSIEWYKDGRPYPWPGEVSNLIIYPESANQTVYTQTVQDTDGGNYSCLLRNDTAYYWHVVVLTVLDSSGYSGLPLPTYEPKDQMLQLGDDVRLFCEAFVGHIQLPDVHNAIVWKRDNSTAFHQHIGISQEVCYREDKQILGSYLTIRGVRREDLGLYVCRISNLDLQTVDLPVWIRQTDLSPQREPARTASRRLLLVLAVTVASALTLLVLYLRFEMQLRLLCRDSWLSAGEESDDGKLYDAVVCYEEGDSDFVVGVMVPSLQGHYCYTCVTCCLPPYDGASSVWSSHMGPLAQRARRLVVVLTPSLVANKWCSTSVRAALTTLHHLHPALVCVTLQSLPPCDAAHKEDGHGLRELVRAAPPVPWTGSSDAHRRRFWAALRLRLRLPPRDSRPRWPGRRDASACAAAARQQMTQMAGVAAVAAASKRRSLRCNSHESLEVLV